MNPELLALDPLFLTNVKLFIKDLVSIEKVDNVPTGKNMDRIQK
jgi:hypothetical protein